MLTEREYREVVRQRAADRQRAERTARGEPGAECGYAAPLPPNLTSRQKLDVANANFVMRESFTEPPLTDEERGMSLEAFNRLPPHRRNQIYDIAIRARRAIA